MKRLIALILTLSLAVAVTVGCDRSYDEGEVRAAAVDLLEKSKLVNEIFYGEGIEYDESSTVTVGNYYPASEEYLSAIGISGEAGLKELTKGVYTDGLCEIIFSTKFSSVWDDDRNVALRRYFDKTVGGKTYLMVNSAATVNFDNEIEYLYETLTVLGADGEYINIELDVLLTNRVGETRTATVEFTLLEENDGFRLDTLSFVKY